ncbi:MAG: TonB-dependent receptor [Melioribacteraceae bacterium]|nr:TonB-dependent receptor [Melioribacteraceae bacterium]
MMLSNQKEIQPIKSSPAFSFINNFPLQSVSIFQLISLLIIFAILLNSKISAQEDELTKLLQLDLEELTDLKIISATKRLNRISEVPATVRVIKTDEIKENGYLTLEEILSDLPGFQFRNIQGFNSYVFQRGIINQNNYTLLLVDGVEINELSSGGFYAGGQFNLDDIEQIEVVYGPASSLYGTNAISGVINIITKNPEAENEIHISGLIGSFNTYTINSSYSFYDEEEKLGLRISGMYYNSEKADLAGVNGDFNWSPDMENFERDYSLNLKTAYNNFILGVLFQNKQASRTTNYRSVGTNYLDKNSLWNISFANIFMKHSLFIQDNLDIQSKVAYTNTTVHDNTIAYVTDTSQVGYYRPNYSLTAELVTYYQPLSELKLIGGINFKSEWLSKQFSITESNSSSEKPPIPSEPNIDRNDILSLFIQSELSLLRMLNFFIGARYDQSSVYGDVITPRVGLVLNYERLTLKALYSEAFRAPKPWDYTSGLGNPNLTPEKMRSFELAGGYSFANILKVGVSFYNNKLIDIIDQEFIGNEYKWVNKGIVKVRGVETTTDIYLKNVKAYMNYTYNFSTNNDDIFLPEISRHIANVGVNVKLSEVIKLSLRGNYIGKRTNPQVITNTGNDLIDAAFILHSALTYTALKNLNLTLSIKNILDTEYYHTSNRPPDRYRQPQRTILFNVDFSF